MGYQALLVDRADGIATVTMNRPEARNALDLTMPFQSRRSPWWTASRSAPGATSRSGAT